MKDQSAPSSKLYTPQFVLICFVVFLFFMSFNMIIPELPDFLSSFGGEEYKGYIISVSALVAGFARPFSGKIADSVGRKFVVYFGVVITVICAASYPFLMYILPFFALRFLHGLSVGFAPTGTSALVADLASEDRRGEAMGIVGLVGNTGTSIAPVLGSYITETLGINFMFFTSSLLSVLCIIAFLGVKETLLYPKKFHKELLILERREWTEPSVFPAAIVMALTLFTYGAFLTVIPDFSKHLGLANKGIFFTIYTLSSILTRVAAGKFSDRYGREIVIKIALFFSISSLFIFSVTEAEWQFYAASIMYGAAVGMYSPAIFAWATDLSHPEHRGRGMSTLYIALEGGIAAGAFFAGLIYANVTENLFWVFWLCIVLKSAALAYLFSLRKS
jgi:MFS family permease